MAASSLVRIGLRALDGSGLFRALIRARSDSLQILCYHRIQGQGAAPSRGYRGNVSATEEGFAAQLDLIRHHYNVISMEELLDFVTDSRPLPPRSALVTFDDGYRDNLAVAAPLLARRNIPWTLFVATSCVEGSPFDWDVAAEFFEATEQSRVSLPILGERTVPEDRGDLLEEWLAAIKRVPHAARREAMSQLPRALRVAEGDAIATRRDLLGLYLTHDQLGRLPEHGAVAQAHTHTHPILTRLSAAEAALELRRNRELLARYAGAAPRAFAYPNGQTNDFSSTTERIVRDAGFEVAFTLRGGPVRHENARRHRFRIERTYIGPRDAEVARFRAKCSGFTRLLSANRLGRAA